MKYKLLVRPSVAVLAIALSSLALYACGQNNGQSATSNTTADASGAAPLALPLTTGAQTAPVEAPVASSLPAAPRPKIVRVASQADQYAYVDQASSMGSALGHAPPDYGFDYDGVHPWVWRTHNNAARLVEPTSGGYRYYFYQPGASEPYLIRDPQYAYGFNNGELVVVYDARGNVLPPQYMDQQADYAGRYLARARALYDASLRSQRRSVIAANWAARSDQIDDQQAEWDQQQSQYSAWRQYHQQHEAEQQAYWQGERDQRAASAQQFNQWHDAGYQGPPPPPAYGPIAGAAGAALIGGAIGGYFGGRDHHDDRNATQSGPQGGPGYPLHIGGRGEPGFENGGPQTAGSGYDQRRGDFNQRQGGAPLDPSAAVAQARQQHAQADAARQVQLQQQAQAADSAREQAIAQGRTQQAAADAARQADAQHQAQALQGARNDQARANAAARGQAALQVHQQQAAQATAASQAQEASHAQASQGQEQQAAQMAAQRQVQAMQAHQAVQAASAAHANQAQAVQAQMEAARKAQGAEGHPHPDGPHGAGEHPHHPGEGPPPAQQ